MQEKVLCVTIAQAIAQKRWDDTMFLYQIYPRSFKDSNGDGVGDLQGVIQKMPYIQELGANAIWLSPINKSPLKDFGYDISDYRDVDPIYGTLDDLKDLIKTCHALGIYILLDLVPNHTSDEHEWFLKSVQRIEPYDDYYVWQDTVPNNWKDNITGSSSWSYNKKRGQYYLHQFTSSQPDLNYRNPNVRAEMEDIMRYWLDLEMDGFRVDAVPFLFEDEQLRNETILYDSNGNSVGLTEMYTQNQPESYELLRSWAELLLNYSKEHNKTKAMVAEAYANLTTTMAYCGSGNLSFLKPFNIRLMLGNEGTTAPELKGLMQPWLDAMPKEASPMWGVSNHDQSRVATRYGPEFADAINMIIMCAPGSMIMYYGQEIGMTDTFITYDRTVDEQGRSQGPDLYQTRSRDPERTPMQWDDSVSAGFSTNKTTWLPTNPNYWRLNVENQKRAKFSSWKVVRDLAEVRKDPVMISGDTRIITPNDYTFIIIRTLEKKSFCLLVNMGVELETYNSTNTFDTIGLSGNLTVVVASTNSGSQTGDFFQGGVTKIKLRPRSAVLCLTT